MLKKCSLIKNDLSLLFQSFCAICTSLQWSWSGSFLQIFSAVFYFFRHFQVRLFFFFSHLDIWTWNAQRREKTLSNNGSVPSSVSVNHGSEKHPITWPEQNQCCWGNCHCGSRSAQVVGFCCRQRRKGASNFFQRTEQEELLITGSISDLMVCIRLEG